MFLTVHGPIGALIGAATREPLSALVLGVISHFLIDMIPHGDENLLPENGDHRRFVRILAIAALADVIVMVVVLGLLLRPWDEPPSRSVLAGVLGGILPDFVNGAAVVLRRFRICTWYHELHEAIHRDIIPREARVAIGMAVQVLTLVVTSSVIIVLR